MCVRACARGGGGGCRTSIAAGIRLHIACLFITILITMYNLNVLLEPTHCLLYYCLRARNDEVCSCAVGGLSGHCGGF